MTRGMTDLVLDGLGTWLWALAEHMRRTSEPLPLEWDTAVDLVARYKDGHRQIHASTTRGGGRPSAACPERSRGARLYSRRGVMQQTEYKWTRSSRTCVLVYVCTRLLT